MLIATYRVSSCYMDAKERLIAQGYAHELDWQAGRTLTTLEEPEFLRQTAWVILSSGFRTSVVERLFPAIERAFLYWQGAANIVHHSRTCRADALRVFNSERKIGAICAVAQRVSAEGMDQIRRRIMIDGQSFVASFPYMGPVTSLHLMKNIGLQVAKPDRHLARIARAAGYDTAQALCAEISGFVGDSIPEVDYVLWRSATLNPDFERTFLP